MTPKPGSYTCEYCGKEIRGEYALQKLKAHLKYCPARAAGQVIDVGGLQYRVKVKSVQTFHRIRDYMESIREYPDGQKELMFLGYIAAVKQMVRPEIEVVPICR